MPELVFGTLCIHKDAIAHPATLWVSEHMGLPQVLSHVPPLGSLAVGLRRGGSSSACTAAGIFTPASRFHQCLEPIASLRWVG